MEIFHRNSLLLLLRLPLPPPPLQVITPRAQNKLYSLLPPLEEVLQYTRYPSTPRGSSLAVKDRTLDVRVTSDRPITP